MVVVVVVVVVGGAGGYSVTRWMDTLTREGVAALTLAVAARAPAAHPLDLVLETHLGGVRVDALRECQVLVHHVAAEVRVAHAQHGRAVGHVRRADLALGM